LTQAAVEASLPSSATFVFESEIDVWFASKSAFRELHVVNPKHYFARGDDVTVLTSYEW
jgi:hypothetical protein